MTYEEFVREIEKLGLAWEIQGRDIVVRSNIEPFIAYVDRVDAFSVCTSGICGLSYETQRRSVLELCCKLASTPIEERGAKKYRLRLRGVSGIHRFLKMRKSGDEIIVSNAMDDMNSTSLFTEEEIEELREKLPMLVGACEKTEAGE